MSFIGKRINKLNKLSVLTDADNFIIDSPNLQEARKVSVSDVRDAVITSDLVDGSTVELQMITTAGKQSIVNALEYHNVSADVTETFSSLEKKVEDLNTAVSKDKKNIPWINCYEESTTSFVPDFSNETNILINPLSYYCYTPLENGVLEVGKITVSDGSVVISPIKTDTNGTWQTLKGDLFINKKQTFTQDGGIVFIADTDQTATNNTGNITIVKAVFDETSNEVNYTTKVISMSDYSTSRREYVYFCDENNNLYISWISKLTIINIDTGVITKTDIDTNQQYCSIVVSGNTINLFNTSGAASYATAKLNTYINKNGTVSLLKTIVLRQSASDNGFINYYIKDINSIIGYNYTKTYAYIYNLDTFEKKDLKISDNSKYFNIYNLVNNYPYSKEMFQYNLQGTFIIKRLNKYILMLKDYVSSVCVYDNESKTLIFPYITGLGTKLTFTEGVPYSTDIRSSCNSYMLYGTVDNILTIYVTIPSSGSTAFKSFAVNSNVELEKINAIEREGHLYLLGGVND